MLNSLKSILYCLLVLQLSLLLVVLNAGVVGSDY
jgi:hypothetical protein